MATNERGHQDAVPPGEYGINDAGSWSAHAEPFTWSEDVVDAAKFSYEDLSLVDASTQSGDTGPLGGSTPGENPLA